MKIVLDNNILFSLMNPKSTASYIFSLINAEFFAPDFIIQELYKYKEECLIKSNLSEQEFEIRLSEIKNSIEFIGFEDYFSFLAIAINNLEDIKDSPYLAVALSLNTSIWSNDPHLIKQTLVKVYTTEELFEKLINL